MRENKLFVLGVLVLLLISPVVIGATNSKNITFSLNQTDYYFKVGEDAIIPLEIENSYGKQINGILTYTYTQQINQGGMYISSSKSNSITFSVREGKTIQRLNFGTSNTPSTIKVELKFSYTEKELEVVDLKGIKIHFVAEESQKKNELNKVSSSAEKYSQSNSQQSPFPQIQNQINNQINKFFQNQPQQTSKHPLSNTQMPQDSSTLKREIENQAKRDREMKKEFLNNLAKNEEFRKEHQNLISKGYNLTNMNMDLESNNTGDFEFEYRKPNGEKASLRGHLENGKLNNMQKDTPEMRKKMLKELEKNKKFQEYQNQLQKQGYSLNTTEFSQEGNKTKIKLNYTNSENKTATIIADIVNNTVQNVELKNEIKKSRLFDFLWFFILVIAGIVVFFSYKIHKKTKMPEIVKVENKELKEHFDYKEESKKMVEEAKKLFERKEYKEAYGRAGQALRLYLSYKNNLKKEITNDELIEHLRKSGQEYRKIKTCLDLCSLVEFAKYKPNKKDFDKIIGVVEKEINLN